MKTLLESLGPRRNFDSPPIHLWHPPLSGDIDIRIDAHGTWFHEGGKIERESLVRLFASILRREEDNRYYLVTPSEKWRINVETHPLLITDIDVEVINRMQVLQATLNTGRRIVISTQHPLFLDPAVGNIAVMRLPHGLTAQCTRSAWYRLVDLAEAREHCLTLKSGDFTLTLPVDEIIR